MPLGGSTHLHLSSVQQSQSRHSRNAAVDFDKPLFMLRPSKQLQGHCQQQLLQTSTASSAICTCTAAAASAGGEAEAADGQHPARREFDACRSKKGPAWPSQ
jgi:hypothetical protein